jgi:beta-glucosidase
MSSATTLRFPKDFFWGAATAAHQIEGNNVSSDWWRREQSSNSGLKERSADACDSYNRYEQDIRLLAESGLQYYRFSIEWARIEPEPEHFSTAQILHYRDMIDTCRHYGVEPMVTLNHMTLPYWFAEQGGWKSADAVSLFSRYVRRVAPILHDITYVCTINEPNMVAMTRGGKEGTNMTAGALPVPDLEIGQTLVKAHKEACRILHETYPNMLIGWTVATQAFHAMPGCEQETEEYAWPRENFYLEAAKGDDWIGVQGYLRTFIGKDGPQPVPDGAERTLCGWEYFPPAIGIGVRNAWERTGHIPIIVTENGLATSDDNRRIDYTFGALQGLKSAMDDGIDVRGYIHWSLLDNYEWGSYTPTFGLVSVDPDTFERHAKPSLRWLGNIAESGIVKEPVR